MVKKDNQIYLNLINKYTFDTKNYYIFKLNLKCNEYYHILQRLMLILYNVLIICITFKKEQKFNKKKNKIYNPCGFGLLEKLKFDLYKYQSFCFSDNEIQNI